MIVAVVVRASASARVGLTEGVKARLRSGFVFGLVLALRSCSGLAFAHLSHV